MLADDEQKQGMLTEAIVYFQCAKCLEFLNNCTCFRCLLMRDIFQYVKLMRSLVNSMTFAIILFEDGLLICLCS